MVQPYHHGSLPTVLLEAAETILERDGIGALTMRAAAREAGVSHAAPAHHFRDLSGLLSELAACGFVRMRGAIEAEIAGAGADRRLRLVAGGRGYVGFARAYPGLFQLMFRSERLDWSLPTLAEAGSAAFALLTQDDSAHDDSAQDDRAQDDSAGALPGQALRDLVNATARWSLMHGLATLLIDGRLESVAGRVPGASADEIIGAVLMRLVRSDDP